MLGNVTEYSYDAYDRLEKVEDASGICTVYEYDSYHNLITETVTAGETVSEQTQKDYWYTYDEYGNQTSSSYSVNGGASITTTVDYDQGGGSNQEHTIVTSIDSMGYETEYTYDGQTDVLLKVYRCNYSETSEYPEISQTTYEYDDMFRVTEVSAWLTAGNNTSLIRYSYTGDKLTGISTNSVSYSITYGPFGQRTGVYVDGEPLVQYE